MAEASGEVKLEEAILGSGLIGSGSHGVALLSGGPDSVGLVSGLVRAVGSDHLTALHVNYGLRSDSDLDQEACQVVCAKLGVELITVRAGERDGNLHDWARGVRYREASLLAERLGLDWIAVGHTRTDLVETVLYRLASSPGTRALRAMPVRRGLLVRPLLSLGRGEVRRAVEESGLPFVDDPSNLAPGFARARIRTGAMPVLGGVNPAFERNVLRTLAELEEEASFLDAEGGALIEEGPNGQPAIDTAALMQADPAVARHALRLLIGATCGREAPVSIDRTALVRELSGRPEGGSVDFGDGIRIEIGSG
ncbi:MAG: tRNA lysidine(34) synthetase TilS, partial [Solirubrobacterales bacterium]